MKPQDVPIPFPFGGLNIATAFEDQPRGTTPSCLNVWGYDVRAGRYRGSVRYGLTKYCPLQVSGTNPVQDIQIAVTTTSAAGTSPPATSLLGAFVYSGNLSPNSIYIVNDQDTLFANFGTLNPLGYCWDTNNNVYAAFASGTHVVISCYAIKTDGSTNITATLKWTSGNLNTADQTSMCAMCFGPNNFVYVASAKSGTTYVYQLNASSGAITGGAALFSTGKSPQNAGNYMACAKKASTAGVLIVGYNDGTADYYDIGAASKANHTVSATQAVFDTDSDGSNFYVATNNDGLNPSVLYKMGPTGVAVWTYTGTQTSAPFASCSWDPISTNVGFSYNHAFANGHTVAIVNQSATLVTSFSTAGTTNQIVRADGFGNWLIGTENATPGVTFTLKKPLFQVPDIWTDGGKSGSSLLTVPYVAMNTIATSTSGGALSPRILRPLAVSSGTVVKFNRSTITQITNGPNALSAVAPMVFSSQLFQQVYFFDGVNWKYYDCPTDSILTLTASSGSLPVDSAGNTPRLGCEWRDRLVVSGLILDPFNWFMSAVGDATNWNYNPTPALETQACAGSNISTSSPSGESADIVNALFPYSDEVLILFGDHSIRQMTGDPAAGGRIDLVTDVIGSAWGRPFCRDGQGNLYFFSNRGTIYRFAPGSLPEPISTNIQEALVTINVGSFAVRMAWDERWYGFNVWLTPWAAPQVTTHYFYDVRKQAWWPVQYGSTNYDPVACIASDGDSVQERVILIGGRDGYIRFLDITNNTDDGTAIPSSIFLGPISTDPPATIIDLQGTLDSGSGSLNYSFYPGPNAQAAFNGTAVQSGTLSAGRNHSQAVRVFGHAAYITLSSTNVWQLEKLLARLQIPDGKARQRVF